MNNVVSVKTKENVRKLRDIKIFTIEKKRNNLVPKPNYHIAKFFNIYQQCKWTKRRYLSINLLM